MNNENPNHSTDNIMIKKYLSAVAMVILVLMIGITAFAFGRDGDNKIKTDDSHKESSVTTTIPEINTTTTIPKVTISEKKNTTPFSTTKKSIQTTVTTTKKPVQTTVTTTKKPVKTTVTTTTRKPVKTTVTTTKKPVKTTVTTTKKPVQTTVTTTTKKPVSSGGKLVVEYEIPGTWNDSVNDFAQVNVTINNNTSSTKTGWVAILTFNKEVTVSQYWNCGITANGNTLTIKPWQFNNEIVSGENTTFGLIVSGKGKITVSSISVN
ncbi:MAG: hypothetical protein E7509_07025 [Ruminococcus sp.]|nr:hypothetical protein [Ruminococcus sp.]